jgi:pimeloyl-ACP methyl ester carboxylesterase
VATYVLVHGSWMGAWWWDDVAAALRRAGHAVHTPDLDDAPGTGPMEHAAAVATLLDERALRGVVLAGHSSGGLVIAAAAERCTRRVARLVYVDALVPGDGDSLFSLRPHVAAERRAAGARDGLLAPPAPGVDDPAGLAARLRPWPLAAQERPVRLAGAAAGLPATYVHCVRSDFAEQAARARERGFAVVTIDAGHHVALEDPGALAAVLLRVAPASE